MMATDVTSRVRVRVTSWRYQGREEIFIFGTAPVWETSQLSPVHPERASCRTR